MENSLDLDGEIPNKKCSSLFKSIQIFVALNKPNRINDLILKRRFLLPKL